MTVSFRHVTYGAVRSIPFRSCLWRRVAAGAAAGLACLVVLFAAGCGGDRAITVTSKPDGATVWVGNEILGPAPQTVPIPDNLGVRVRVAMPGYTDWERRFSPDELIPGKTYQVELRPRDRVSVRLRSVPSDARVHVNGTFRGRTPLVVGDLPAGETRIAFATPGWETVERVVRLEAGEGTRTVSVTLSGMTDDIYRLRMRENPDDLENYADLAHYYALQHRFQEMAETLRTGLRLYLEGKAGTGASRLLQELHRIPAGQFNYGTGEQVEKVRKMLVGELRGIVKEFPKAHPQVYHSLIYVLHTTGEAEEAKEVTRQAAVLYPDDRHIKRYIKRFRISVDNDK